VRDVLAAAARAPAGVPLVGIGHSFGGAALLKAELARPGTFAALVLSEPILFDRDMGAGDRSALADRARKRRAQWSSRAEARAFFVGRPLFQAWHPAALAGYLEGGLVESRGEGKEGASGEVGEVRLACTPDSEAACYGGVGRSVFSALPQVSCPVTVLVGATSQHLDRTPSDDARATTTLEHFQGLAQRLARGTVVVVDGAGHFHPQERPSAVARAVDAAMAAAISAAPPRPRL
jgi:pimeloyl-ACP methyl ester carboxylesterase